MQRYFAFLRICLCCAYFTHFSTVTAQNADTVKTIPLREVQVVRQGRTPVTQQTAPLQVVDNKTIQRMGINNLSDVVKTFSGVTVKDYGGIGGLKTVSIRSLGAHHTAVGYDGIAVSDAQSGQIDISRFSLENVDYVSLSIGQTDDIFLPARLFASAGAINIQTQKPDFQDKNHLFRLKLKNGSFGLLNPSVSYAQKLNSKWNTTVYGDYLTAKGNYPYTLINGTLTTREKRINSDMESSRIEADFRGQIGYNSLLNIKLYTYHSERGLPGSVHFYNNTATERLWNDISFVQAHYKNQINNRLSIQSALKYNYSYSRYKNISDIYTIGYQEDKNTQQEFYGTLGALYAFNNVLSTTLTTDYAMTTLKNNFPNSTEPLRNTSLTVWAAKYKKSNFTLTGSLLYSLYADKTNNQGQDTKRQRLSPALATSWQPFENEGFRIRASYKDGFRVPTFTDLYYLRIGNANLKPETSRQWNVGVTWNGNFGRLKNVNFTTDAYYNNVDNKIVAIPTLYIWKMMNLGKAEMKGVDINLSGEIPLSDEVNIFLSGNYSYQRAIDVTDPQAKNYKHQIPYTPRHSGNGSLSVENRIANISYFFTAAGQRYALPQNIESNSIKGYSEHNISINKTLNFKYFSLRLQGEVLNLLNTQYDVIQYYPMPGRSWRISLEFSY